MILKRRANNMVEYGPISIVCSAEFLKDSPSRRPGFSYSEAVRIDAEKKASTEYTGALNK